MTASDHIARDTARVKAELLDAFSRLLDPLLDAASTGALTPREAERRTWSAVVQLGALVLAAVLSTLCRRATERAVAELGLDLVELRLRMDRDYFATIKTTFGAVRFPWYAFRDGDGRTRVPARELFPLHDVMRVSEVLLEWESALATDHPFRKAAEALLFFTHEAADVEDNTIERHAVLVGQSIPRTWQYRRPEDIRDVLRDHATRDTETGRPIVYASTDAHALTRFVDDTWAAAWKMTNGIRLWCIDAKTGATVHLGGEYTWGDCHEVARLFRALQADGILPADGDYGDGVLAQIALVTDGSPWILEHIVPLFPGAVAILDPYHVIEHVADVARLLYPKSPKKARRLVERARRALGFRKRRARAQTRKGPRKPRPAHRKTQSTACAWHLGEVLAPLHRSARTGASRARIWRAMEFVAANDTRMDYGQLRARGFQIGSGAMESLHRTASQLRLKRPGCRWTAEAAQAILNLRMLQLCGRWDEWWRQPGVAARVVEAAA